MDLWTCGVSEFLDIYDISSRGMRNAQCGAISPGTRQGRRTSACMEVYDKEVAGVK